MSSFPDGEPVNVAVYIDYRDNTLDNYPNIHLCDECAEELEPRVSEVDRLKPGEEAECESCFRRNTAAMHSSE